MKTYYPYLLLITTGCIIATHQFSWGQASRSAFNFIENPSFSKLSALGGVNLTAGNDPLMFMANPALLDTGSIHTPSFNYLNFPGGINVATLGYNFKGLGKGTMGVGLQYFNYGRFEGFDDIGLATGEFNANEYALVIGYAIRNKVFSYGANLKMLGSVLEGYQAHALVVDFGVNFLHPEHDLVLAMNARNIGFILGAYTEGVSLQLPADFRIGGSFKPEYAPFRFHLTLRNLQRGEVDFYIPDPFGNSGELPIADRIFRRMVFGVELLPSENFNLRLGYNHLIRKEFETESGAGAGGFSGGFAFKVKKFELSYSRMFYNVPGGSNIFGITTLIKDKRTF